MRSLVMTRTWRLVAPLLLFLSPAGWVPAASGQTPEAVGRALGQLAPDLYELRDGGQRSLIVVGHDGIAVIDPLNVEVARWLKDDLAQRFPGRPVKYVVYSGVDYDRVAGAGVFGLAADVLARDSFAERAALARKALPPRIAPLDANRNGSIERGEASSPALLAMFDRMDARKSGALAPGQLWGDVLSPESVFTSRRSIDLGGAAFELVYAGPAWGSDATLVYFPAHRLVFAPRYAPLATPLSDRTVRAAAVAQWTGTLLKLEFDTLLDGAGGSNPRADVVAADRYVRTLLDGVTREADRGLSIADIQSGTVVESFAGTPFARQRDADIAAVFRRRTVLLLDVIGGGIVNYSAVDGADCGDADSICAFGRTGGPGFTAGVGASIGWIRIRAEHSAGPERSMTLTSDRFYYRAVDNSRDNHTAVLGGVRAGAAGAFNVTALGGFAFVTRKQAGRLVTSANFVSPYSYASSVSAMALTFGADVSVPVSSRVAVVAPIRFTTRPDELHDSYSKGLDMRLGAGLSLSLFRKPF